MKIALIVGHEENAQGAYNETYDVTEYDFNTTLVEYVSDFLKLEDIDHVVVFRENGYSQLPYDVNRTGADLAIEFHFNGAGPRVNGSEVIYYPGSIKGERFAEILQRHTVECLGFKDRGIKTPVNGRGNSLLRLTKMPTVIYEPFFGTNDRAMSIALDRREEIAGAVCDAIKEYIG